MARIYGHESNYIKGKRFNFRLHEYIILLALIALIYWHTKVSSGVPKSLSETLIIAVIFIGVIKLLSRRFYKEDRGYRRTGRGLKGEDEIVHELKKLPDEYSVFRNVSIHEGCDIDCIVVGPNGVFTIETKSHSGRIDFNGRELTLNGAPFLEKNVLAQAMGGAMDVHTFLREKLNREVFVTPILVFASKFVSIGLGMKPIHGVYVVQKSWLRECITQAGSALQGIEDINKLLEGKSE